MPILTTLFRAHGVNVHGKTIARTAVRAVIQRSSELLMIYSARVGYYKFPGGGVAEGESQAEALRRETLEECGATLTRIGREIGCVVEYNFAVEDEFDTFKMTSHYFLCETADVFTAQHLDEYEADLGFEPRWVSIEEALSVNRSLLRSESAPDWLKREIFLLAYLQRRLPRRRG
jgi:8-oxo-dGTP pyrophosphatase MutT (NUDIX family)